MGNRLDKLKTDTTNVGNNIASRINLKFSRKSREEVESKENEAPDEVRTLDIVNFYTFWWGVKLGKINK